MSRTVSKFSASVEIEATAKSLRAFVVTNWRKARVPDDVLRGRAGHDEATPVTDRHYHYREEVADRQETDQLAGGLLYEQEVDQQQANQGQDQGHGGAEIISLHAARARRRLA